MSHAVSRPFRTAAVAVLLALVPGAFVASANAQTSQQIRQLPGGRHFADDMNERGVIVGRQLVAPDGCTADCRLRTLPTVWQTDGTRVVLATGTAAGEGGAYDINDAGVIVGDVHMTPGVAFSGPLPVVWDNVAEEPVRIAIPAPQGSAYLINNHGLVAGIFFGDNGLTSGFLWSESSGLRVFDIGYGSMQPRALNDNGTLVLAHYDHATQPSTITHWLWDEVSGLRQFEPGLEPTFDLNEQGLIVGRREPAGTPYAGTHDLSTGVTSLLPLVSPQVSARARAVNNSGDIGGSAYLTTGGPYATLWTGGRVLRFPLAQTEVDTVTDSGLALVSRIADPNTGGYVWRFKGLEVDDVDIQYGSSWNLQARLVAEGLNVEGRTVSFAVSGVGVGSAQTDAYGRAALPFNAGTLDLGTYEIEASFAGDQTLTAVSGTGTLRIGRAEPLITWPEPAPLLADVPLGPLQLNATASVPGVFTYEPAAGTLLAPGRHRIHATFTPLDTARYVSMPGQWTIVTVLKAGSASDVQPAAIAEDCTSEHEFGLDESEGRVIGISWVKPALCDVDSGQSLFEFPDGATEWPNGVAVDSGRRRVYATDYYQPVLYVFDADSFALMERIPLSALGFGVIVEPSSGRIYVGGRDEAHALMVVDGTSRTQLGTVPNAPVPDSMALDPTRKRLFLSHEGGFSLVDVDANAGTAGTVLQTVEQSPGAGPYSHVAVNRVTGRVYYTQGPSLNDTTLRTFIPSGAGYVPDAEASFLDGYLWNDFWPNNIARLAVDPARNSVYALYGDPLCSGYCQQGILTLDATTLELTGFSRWNGYEEGYGHGPLLWNAAARRLYSSRIFPTYTDAKTRIYVDAPAVTSQTTTSSPVASAPGVTVAFTTVQQAGVTTIAPVATTNLPPAPGQFTFENGLAFEVSSTATYSGTLTLCFATGVSDPTVFAALHVLHGENGVWVDRTSSRDYATGTICATTTSLSPFVVARRTTPAIEVGALYNVEQIYKRGSTIPVRIQLFSAGANISSAGLPVSAVEVRRLADASAGAVVDAGNANPDSTFRYDPSLGGSGGYIFNLSTKALTAGRYELRLSASGQVLSVPFQVR